MSRTMVSYHKKHQRAGTFLCSVNSCHEPFLQSACGIIYCNLTAQAKTIEQKPNLKEMLTEIDESDISEASEKHLELPISEKEENTDGYCHDEC